MLNVECRMRAGPDARSVIHSTLEGEFRDVPVASKKRSNAPRRSRGLRRDEAKRAFHSTKKLHDQVTRLDRPLPPGEGRGEGLPALADSSISSHPLSDGRAGGWARRLVHLSTSTQAEAGMVKVAPPHFRLLLSARCPGISAF